MSATRMVNVRMPVELLEEVDRLASEGERTAFILDAVKREVRKRRLLGAIEHMTGRISAEDAPHWATPEQVTAWVRTQRSIDSQKGLPDR